MFEPVGLIIVKKSSEGSLNDCETLTGSVPTSMTNSTTTFGVFGCEFVTDAYGV